MTPAYRFLFARVLGGLLLVAAPLASQSGFTWRGDIGLRYFGRNPFVSQSASWRYLQAVADFSLSGHVWDPRFLVFDLGGNLIYTAYGGSTGSQDYRNIGYRLAARFFPRSKFSFGLRYLRNDSGTSAGESGATPLRYATSAKGLDLSLSRIKHLPSVRLAYNDRTYRSTISDSPNDERNTSLDLGVSQAARRNTFNLSYRRERYENQVVERDRSYNSLRLTERLQLGGETMILFDGVVTKNALDLPAGRSFQNSYGQFSGNALARLSDRLRGNLRYAYVRNTVDGRFFSLHRAQANLHISLKKGLVLSPLFDFSRSGIETPVGEDVLRDARAGARLTWNDSWRALTWTTHIALVYRRQDSREQGKVRDLAQSLGASLSVGKLESLLGSVSYAYSGTDAEVAVPEYGDPLFYYGIGTNLDRHLLRLELRTRGLKPLDTYLYTRYDRYDRELYGQGSVEATVVNHGLRLGWGRLSLAASLGSNALASETVTARYRTLNSTLDVRLSRALDFRVQFVRRRRQDVLTGRDFNRTFSFFLNYTVARFKASLIYQNLGWELDGPLRRDEVLSVTFTRSFGTRR